MCDLADGEHMAAEILGERKVVGYRDACLIWRVDLPDAEPALPYTEEVLRQATKRNQNGEDWRLVYCTGLSLRSQLGVMGDNRKKQPCFHPDDKWWLESPQDGWAKKDIKPRYRLLDFTKRFTRMWAQQNEDIAASGGQFERAEEQAVAEACLSNYFVNGKERLLQDWFHWGRLQPAYGRRVYVGHFRDDGFRVHSYWVDYVVDCLGVVRAWKSA